MTNDRWRNPLLVLAAAACFADPLAGVAQSQGPKAPPVADKPADKAEKPPARRARAPQPKADEERPRPDVPVAFPVDI